MPAALGRSLWASVVGACVVFTETLAVAVGVAGTEIDGNT